MTTTTTTTESNESTLKDMTIYIKEMSFIFFFFKKTIIYLILESSKLFYNFMNYLNTFYHVEFECFFYYNGNEMCIRHFNYNDFPLHFNSSIERIEIRYKENGKYYRFVEKNYPSSYNKICNLPPDNYEGVIGPKGVLTCNLDSIDITSLIIEYQGPNKDFYCSDLRLKDIDVSSLEAFEGVRGISSLEILDMNFDTHLFKYDDLIVL
jgi:hypothetical protein